MSEDRRPTQSHKLMSSTQKFMKNISYIWYTLPFYHIVL